MSPVYIGAFIPIILFLVTGVILVTLIYYKSREKQMMIEKGLSPEEMSKFLERKGRLSPYTMLKIGIVTIFFGLGLGFGMMVEEYSGADYAVPLFLFTLTGLGFVISFFVVEKLEKQKTKIDKYNS